MGKEAGYFGNCGELLAILESKTDKSQLYYWRMSQLSLIEGWEQSLERFPKSAIMRSGLLYEQVILGRPIEEKGGFVSVMLPTPSKNSAKNNPCTPSQWRKKDCLNVEIAKMLGKNAQTIGKKTRLNPRFVRWMMGFPIGWLN
jgi:hypothetical protein